MLLTGGMVVEVAFLVVALLPVLLICGTYLILLLLGCVLGKRATGQLPEARALLALIFDFGKTLHS